MEEPQQDSREQIQENANATDAESSKHRPEKDPQKRVARKLNKRQKYKERQAQKSQETPTATSEESIRSHIIMKVQEIDMKSSSLDEKEESEDINVAEAPTSMAELMAQLQREEQEKKQKILELISRGDYDQLDSQDLQSVREKKRVYSAWIGEVGDQNKRAKIDPVGLQVRKFDFPAKTFFFRGHHTFSSIDLALS